MSQHRLRFLNTLVLNLQGANLLMLVLSWGAGYTTLALLLGLGVTPLLVAAAMLISAKIKERQELR